mmetsp:Transcript_23601/g.57872  ORF Transcript_23601/g.57872 Transcript_23601/m.57872 type:complete len:266 (-) Transcript_23601:1254-2051(-)
MKLQGIVFCHFLLGGLTCAFNLHLPTKAFLCSPHTLNKPFPLRAGRSWESSTPRDVIISRRNGSVQSVTRFFLNFLKALVKHPFKLFSRVISINEFKSLMEIAGELHSKENDTINIQDEPKTSVMLKEHESEEVAIATKESKPTEKLGSKSLTPEGERWAVATKGVDFSGKWQLEAEDDQFKLNYDRYLANLGQPLLVRTVALGLIGRTKEDLRMSNDGKSLFIRGENARGIWERELIASGTEFGKPEFEPLHIPIMVRVDSVLL